MTTSRQPQVGDTIAHYRLDHVIGVGGMGQVFGAQDLRLGRSVALKVILGSYDSSDDFVRRFQREAATLSRLDSAHVVSVYDHGDHEGRAFIVTQYAAGGDLGRLLRERGRMPMQLAIRACSQVADALADAHRAGVVHRDVKPANVLLRDDRLDRLHAYLCDFGVALTDSGGNTTAGAVAGTWTYLAPERIAGDPGSPASDIYSVGVLLWELLTGTPPYPGSDVEVAMQHRDAPVPQLAEHDATTAQLNRILARSMAKDPAERYASAAELRTDLRQLLPGGSSTSAAPVVAPRRRRGVLLAAAAVAVLLVAGGVTAVAVTAGDDRPAAGGSPSSPGAPSAETDTGDGTDGGTGGETGDDPGEEPGGGAVPGASGAGSTDAPLGDIDGDGLGDLLVTDTSSTYVALSDGSSFGEVRTRDIDGDFVLLADFDGDRTRELVRVDGDPPTITVTVLFRGAVRQTSTVQAPAPVDDEQRVSSDILAADVDGDGTDDIVVASPDGKDGLIMSVALNRGDGTFAPSETWLESDLPWRRTVWAVADFDADGTDELVHAEPREFDPEEFGAATVLTSTGSALEESSITLDLPKTVPSSFVGIKNMSGGDVDGDGVPELVAHYPFGYGALVWSWTGDGFGEPEVWADEVDPDNGGGNAFSVLSDVNGDGLADVVSAKLFQVRVHLSTGSEFVYAPEWDLRAELPETLISEVGLGIA